MIDARNYKTVETLRSGQIITLRAIRPEDRTLLLEEFHEMDQYSLYLRFFKTKGAITDQELKYFTEVDFIGHVALVVIADLGDKTKIIGGGRYIAYDRHAKVRSAEVAFMVHDRYQGQGIATLLLKHLLIIARDSGIAKFEAEVLPENSKMIAVFSRAGFPMSVLRINDVLHVTLALS
ncbi:MAG: GNAT family N-acetyltransferase [Syntrophobacteraceae bacterium]|jgi:RimJ/RimL family protein N-acetyltransferase